MKRTVEICGSFTGTISTGNWENEKPFFSLKEIMEFGDGEINLSDEEIIQRQEELHKMCYEQFKRQADVSYSEKIAKTYQNIRFYNGENGVKYPSVTSIIGWDDDFRIPPQELAQYGARGTIIHKQIEIFLKTGEWKEPKDIPEIYPDLVILKGGNLGLEIDNVDFRAFYESYPFKVIELEKTVLNHEYRYAGRLDIKCLIESSNKGKWDKIDDVLYDTPTILDIKTGEVNKTKCFKQQTAYSHCDSEIKQIGIIPLTKDTKQGFSKPLIETDTNKYWSLFLKDREEFRRRYGV